MKENQWKFFRELIPIYHFIFSSFDEGNDIVLVTIYQEFKINELLHTKSTKCL